MQREPQTDPARLRELEASQPVQRPAGKVARRLERPALPRSAQTLEPVALRVQSVELPKMAQPRALLPVWAGSRR